MNYQDRYDELDNIVRTLDNLIDDITDKNYIDMLNEIKFEAEDELEEVEEKLYRQEEEEQEELEDEFNRGRL
jgi:ElaB/YqjD/DUF883 family membrane-anchored ribosome-binding protein